MQDREQRPITALDRKADVRRPIADRDCRMFRSAPSAAGSFYSVFPGYFRKYSVDIMPMRQCENDAVERYAL